VGYYLSLHDRDGTPWWKIGAGNGGRFGIGAAGLRDYDISIDRDSGNVGLGGPPSASRRLYVSGSLETKNDGHFGGSVFAGGVMLSSDARYKSDVTPVARPLETLDALRGVSFRWRTAPDSPSNRSGTDLGFIAQEVAAVLPDLVQTNDAGYLSLNYVGVTPVLVEAVKELHRRFDSDRSEHEARLAQKDRDLEQLRGRLARLEDQLAALSGHSESSASQPVTTPDVRSYAR
jgi:hypothetical protein